MLAKHTDPTVDHVLERKKMYRESFLPSSKVDLGHGYHQVFVVIFSDG